MNVELQIYLILLKRNIFMQCMLH